MGVGGPRDDISASHLDTGLGASSTLLSYWPWDALWALSCSPFPALQERGDPPTLVSETLGGSTGCLPTLCGALWGSFLALAVASFFSPLIHFQVV